MTAPEQDSQPVNGKPSSPRWALERSLRKSGLPPPARHIARVLAEETNGTLSLGRWSPTVEQIAEWTGIGHRMVLRYLKVLEQAGWLVAEKQGRRNLYVLRDGQVSPATPIEQDGKVSPMTPIEPEQVSYSTAIGVTHDTPP